MTTNTKYFSDGVWAMKTLQRGVCVDIPHERPSGLVIGWQEAWATIESRHVFS